MKRVLLVDDDLSILKLLTIALPHVSLTCARDGAEAWAIALRDGKPDLLITDYLMPSLFGDQLIAALRALWPDLKVLVLTGHSVVLEGQNQPWWQAESHLGKPFHLQDLRDRMTALLEVPVAAARHSTVQHIANLLRE